MKTIMLKLHSYTSSDETRKQQAEKFIMHDQENPERIERINIK